MKNKRMIIMLVLGALAAITVFGGIAYQTVLAAAPTTTSTRSTSTTSLPGVGWQGGKGPIESYNNQDLATALGITVDALNTAYQNAYTAALKDAVSKGLITQAQADQQSNNGSTFPYGGRWDSWLTQNGVDFNTYLANALGIGVDALKTAYRTAYYTNIDLQVTNGTLTQAQADLMKGKYALYNDSTFQSSMQSAYTSAVNAAVSSGVITQAQADQILSQSGNVFMPGMGGMGGHGGPHGRGGGDFMPGINGIPSTAP
jgi:hypothetical protein